MAFNQLKNASLHLVDKQPPYRNNNCFRLHRENIAFCRRKLLRFQVNARQNLKFPAYSAKNEWKRKDDVHHFHL